MATKDTTPVHEVRPVTQELRIPERFLPTPTIEPGHSFATIRNPHPSLATGHSTDTGHEG